MGTVFGIKTRAVCSVTLRCHSLSLCLSLSLSLSQSLSRARACSRHVREQRRARACVCVCVFKTCYSDCLTGFCEPRSPPQL